MFIKHSIKILLSLLFLFINFSLFAQDSVESEKSLNSEYADKMRSPDYKYNKLENKNESLTTKYLNRQPNI